MSTRTRNKILALYRKWGDKHGNLLAPEYLVSDLEKLIEEEVKIGIQEEGDRLRRLAEFIGPRGL